MLNTLFTGAAMGSGTVPRAVSSAGYNFCRWFGGAVSATLVGYIATWMGSPRAPFEVAVVCCVIAAGALTLRAGTEPATRTVCRPPRPSWAPINCTWGACSRSL